MPTLHQLLLSACVAVGATLALAQPGFGQSGVGQSGVGQPGVGQPGVNQSGTLQPPTKPRVEKPPPPPSAAPRQPVRQTAPGGGTGASSATPAASPKTLADTLPLPLPPPPAPPPPDIKPDATAEDPARPSIAGGAKKEPPTGKLPRFAALRTDEVNLRRGPGTRYPIEWVYRRRDLPVEIEREFEVWRLVRDHEGTRGWIHQATLTGRRTFLITSADATVRKGPEDAAQAVAILKSGVIGRVRSCDAGSEWCQIQAGSYRGYLRRNQIWGVLPGEVVVP